MMVLLVGKDTLKISEAYINAFPAFSCPLFASKNPIVQFRKSRRAAAAAAFIEVGQTNIAPASLSDNHI